MEANISKSVESLLLFSEIIQHMYHSYGGVLSEGLLSSHHESIKLEHLLQGNHGGLDMQELTYLEEFAGDRCGENINIV